MCSLNVHWLHFEIAKFSGELLTSCQFWMLRKNTGNLPKTIKKFFYTGNDH